MRVWCSGVGTSDFEAKRNGVYQCCVCSAAAEVLVSVGADIGCLVRRLFGCVGGVDWFDAFKVLSSQVFLVLLANGIGGEPNEIYIPSSVSLPFPSVLRCGYVSSGVSRGRN